MFENIIFPDYLAGNYIIRLIMASILGAIIGVERDIHGRAAGLRTNLLVSLGAALFMLISEYFATAYGNNADSLIRVDPGRIAAQIVTGIGFLGAGTIIKYGFTVKGLTTAACLWLSAGLGMSVGAGLIDLAIVTTIIGLIGLVLFHYFEKMYAKDSYRILEITTGISSNINKLTEAISTLNLKVMRLDKELDYQTNRTILKFNIRIFHKGIPDKKVDEIIAAVEKTELPVYNIKWFHV